MFVRNCLKAGDFLTVVPVGISLTLQYDEKGRLDRIYNGYPENCRENITFKLLDTFLKEGTVPRKVPIQGSTTYVKGVLYTSKDYNVTGILPGASCDDMIHDYLDNPDSFEFFAGHVESVSVLFRGAVPIRQWLTMSKFKVLPGYLVTSNMNRDAFIKMINTANYPFKFPLIASYMIYRNSEVLFVSTCLKQLVVDDVFQYIDEDGYLKARITGKDKSSVNVDYSDIVHFNIQKNSVVIQDMYGRIIYSTFVDKKIRDKISSKVICVCGNTYDVPASGPVSCSDAHCNSKLYPLVKHFLSVLDLPMINYSRYCEISNRYGSIFSVPTILQAEEYCNIDKQITLTQLLQAIVPVSIVPNSDLLAEFVSKCVNNIDTFKYYIKHTEKILTNLDIQNSVFLSRFISWLQDPYNIFDIENLLDAPQLQIVEQDKRFDGAPIFRNKTIMITGRFLHGSTYDIISILQSYSAKVVTELSENVDCIVTGGTMEDINGVSVKIAKSSNIPVYSELDFFKRYKIDEDLAENL